MKNRWSIALCAVGIHISIGSVYAWSVAKENVMHILNCSEKQITFTFTLAIFFLGLSAAFLGHLVEKKGPKLCGILAAILFGCGLIGSGLAVKFQSLWMLYACYGVLGGFGLGIGYVTPVSTLIKWFPDKRGLATGMAIMGFGFAAYLSSYAMKYLMSIETIGVSGMFYTLGAAYFILMFCSSLYLAPPPADWMPKGYHANSSNKKIKQDLSQLTANQAVKTLRFYCLWLMLFINVTCGIAVISDARAMAENIAGLSIAAAAGMVGVMGIFNGLGRLGWSAISDYLTRPIVWLIFFFGQAILFYMLPKIDNPVVFQAFIFIIISCYGGGFSTMPAFIGDLFGTKQVSAILGYILTAWSAAGIVGPMLLAAIKDKTQSYSATFNIFTIFFLAALVVSIILAINIALIRKNNNNTAQITD